MILVFFDESKPQPDHPHYRIGGICVPEESLSEIENLLNNLSLEIFNDEKLSKKTEFHASHLYNRKGIFKEFNDFEKTLSIFRKFLEIISRPEIGRIDIKINVEKLHQNIEPSKIAFMYFCERVDRYLCLKKQVGMLIGDRENDRVSEDNSIALSQYRADGTKFEYGIQLKMIFESVHFTHSHLSRFLQLADFYTWFLHFKYKNGGSDKYHERAILDLSNHEGINTFPSKYKEWPK